MVKEILYRGKTLDELNQLDVREFSKLLPSRRRRSVLRQFDKIIKFVQRSRKKLEMKKKIRTHFRNMIIVPQMVGWTVFVYNGKEFIQCPITIEMIGHYLGEFSFTRKKVEHSAPGIGATRSSASLSVK